MFYEQQKNAFYEQRFDEITKEQLKQITEKYRIKDGQSEFPDPELIFYKKFKFLEYTLEEMQIQRKDAQKINNIKKEEPKNEKQMINIKKVIPKSKSMITSKFGVKLEDKLDSDSDNSFIIPEEFNRIIRSL